MAGRTVIVLSTGRSGSSLVAGLLAGHGIWTGKCRDGNEHNPKGYFENLEIKRAMTRRFGRDWLGPLPDKTDGWFAQVEGIKQGQGYKDGPWLFKCGAFYWKVWNPFDPVYVKVWRDPLAIEESYRRAGFLKNHYTPEAVKKLIRLQHEEMESIPGPNIDADALVNGSRLEIKSAIESLDLTYKPEAVDEFIEKRFWNEAD